MGGQPTKDGIHSLFFDIYSFMKQQEYTFCVVFTFPRPFILLNTVFIEHELRHCRIRDFGYHFFTSYLDDENIYLTQLWLTCELALKYGAAQDSVKGPLLFIIYMNDFSISLLYIRFFSDDLSVLFDNVNTERLELLLRFKLNFPSSNESKSNYILFNKKKLPERYTYFFIDK